MYAIRMIIEPHEYAKNYDGQMKFTCYTYSRVIDRIVNYLTDNNV